MILAALLGAVLSSIPPPIYVNDGSVQGDRFTRQAGSDRSGDGSPDRPFGSLGKALATAQPGQTIYLDVGLHQARRGWSIPKDGIRLIGAPQQTTRLRVKEGSVLQAEDRQGLALQDLFLEGGRIGVEWVRVRDSSMERVVSVGAATYGILLRDCTALRLTGCATFRAKFRGLQIDRSSGVVVEGHRSAENQQGGIVLRNARGNILRACHSEKNGMSGFFICDRSTENQFWECIATDNRFVGFYLYNGATGNVLRGNTSTGNERGMTASRSPTNRFERNHVVANRTYGFLLKEQSPGNQLSRNRAEKNPEGDLASTADSTPRLQFRNQIGNRTTLPPATP